MQDELATKQIEIMLEMHAKKVLTEVQSLRKEMADLRELVERVAKDQRRFSQPATAPVTRPEHAQHAAPERAPSEKRDPNNLPPELSIEKVFYSGAK